MTVARQRPRNRSRVISLDRPAKSGLDSFNVCTSFTNTSRSSSCVFVIGGDGANAFVGSFKAAANSAASGFHYQSEEFDSHFMVLELVPGSTSSRGGMVSYLPEFDQF